MRRTRIGALPDGFPRRCKISLWSPTSPLLFTGAKSRRGFVVALLFSILIGSFLSGAQATLDGIVLVIADGASLELITAARAYSLGAEGRLALEGFPHTAFVRTYSGSDMVTDSGAAATARGIKAHNRVIGMAHPGAPSSPPSILDRAKAANWSTGVVTDDSVTGATPAAFLVEHPNRDQHEFIAFKMLDQIATRWDIVLGGGAKWFFDRVKDPTVTYKAGERNIVQQTQEKLGGLPVAIFQNWADFQNYPEDGSGPLRPILGVFYADTFPFFADGTRTLRLRDMVEKAVTLLRTRGRPFLLVVEASLPDKAAHLNHAKRALIEVLELDASIEWLRTNVSANTLLLATTDHNNGGFSFNGPPAPLWLRGERLLGRDPLLNTSYFTWASGPGADRKAATTRTRIIARPGQQMYSVNEVIQETDPDYAQPALLPLGSALHTAGDVWLVGDGPGSENVRGFLDNTEIFDLMAKAIEGSQPSSNPK
jgi:alkaline phosphatase